MVKLTEFINEVYPPIVLIGYAIVFVVFAIAKRSEFSLAPKLGGWLLPIGSLFSIFVGFFGTILPIRSVQSTSAVLILLGALGLFGSSMGQQFALRMYTLVSIVLMLVSVGFGSLFLNNSKLVVPFSHVQGTDCVIPNLDVCKDDGYIAFFRIISMVWIFVNGMCLIQAAEASDFVSAFK